MELSFDQIRMCVSLEKYRISIDKVPIYQQR